MLGAVRIAIKSRQVTVLADGECLLILLVWGEAHGTKRAHSEVSLMMSCGLCPS